MDTAFKVPGIGFKVGWDPIIGLIPGAGDLITTGISAYCHLFWQLVFHLPSGVLTRMIVNIALEAVIGAVPLVGDIFDAFYKAKRAQLSAAGEPSTGANSRTTGSRSAQLKQRPNRRY